MAGRYADFIVRHDFETEQPQDLTRKILAAIFIKRWKANKQTIIFIGGDSGEGKSLGAVRLQQLLLQHQEMDIKDYLNDINIYTPLQYPEKMDAMLNDPRLKKIHIMTMHEAREIIRAKLWYDFLTQSVADINTMSRQVKRMLIIVISQFIRDITPDVRYTLNYYCMVERPIGQKARMKIWKIYKDDYDLMNPKIKRRRIFGYIVTPKGKYIRYRPTYLELSMPPKEIVEEFDKQDRDAKSGVIKKKLQKLLKEMRADVGEEGKKLDSMVKFYADNPDNLRLIGRWSRGKYKLFPDFKEMHELTDHEARRFQDNLTNKLKERGIIETKAEPAEETPRPRRD